MSRVPWKIIGAAAIAIVVVVAAVAIVGDPRTPSGDADELVHQAARALRHTPVKGTLVTTVNTPQGETELTAQMHRGEGRFVIDYLSGPAEGNRVHRQRGAVWVEGQAERGPRRADVSERELRDDLLRRNWDFAITGTRRVAGRPTTVVRGTGPGGTTIMAVDRETGFPLHMSRRGRDGGLISETTWTTADFAVEAPPRIDPPDRPEGRHRAATTLQEARAAVDFTVFEPLWIPDGWELQDWYLLERPQHPGGSVVEARYSDGIRTVAIIQRKHTPRVTDRDRPAQNGLNQDPPRRIPGSGRGERTRSVERQEQGAGQGERAGWETRPDDNGAGRHMRGSGGDASRRVIDGTVIIVIGPLSEQQRDRILDEMRAPS